MKVTHCTQLKFRSPPTTQTPSPNCSSLLMSLIGKFCFSFKVKEVDLDTAIKCLAQNYKIFKDSGRGLEPVTLSIADMAEMMNHRKAGKLLRYKRI